MSKRIIQYEIWKECKNRCKFCFLSKDNICTPRDVKMSGIQNAIDNIKNDIKNGRIDGAAIIGGDFWQGEITDNEMKDKFFELINLCFSLLQESKISEVWLSATLTIGDQPLLYEVLDLYYNMINESEMINKRLWICTSYDTIGRFHIPEMHENWKKHMKTIDEKYPKVLKNTSLIITNDLVKKTLSGEFSFRKFEEEYGTKIYMKTPSHYLENWEEGKKEFNDKIVGDFFPERNLTIKFLQKVNEEDPEALNKIMNNNLRAEILVGHGNSGDFDVMIRDQKDIHKNICSLPDDGVDKAMIQKCGHEKQYRCYIDSDKCFMCDLQKIFKVL